ncbi:hypothetical protein K2Y11_17710 [bacterium]|nr:hypothetical protein [bacterium]
MNHSHHRPMCLFGLLLALVFVPMAKAQITGVVSSDVEAYFGSMSDTFQLTEGPTFPFWTANANGPYPVTGPTVPALYAGYPNPSLTFTPNITYDTGHIGPGFADSQLTTANYSIIGNFAGGANTGDAYAQTFGPPISLFQPASATGFAFEKVQFVMTFSVGPSGIAGGAAPAYPFLATGNVLPGGYAQFGANVDYWWIPVIPGTIIPSGPSVNLGTLQYNFFQAGGGSFNTVVNHSPTTLAGASGVGFLQITGEMFVAGDPFSINVVSIPETSTLVLSVVGMIGLAGFGLRKKLHRA